MRDFAHLQAANDVALFLDDAFGKIAPEKLADVDPDSVAVPKRRGHSDRRLAHQDGPIGFHHFQPTDALVVIAKNLQEHITARARRQEDIVGLE